MHSTNYFNTLIEVAEDCVATSGEVPPFRGTEKSAAKLAYELVSEHPYELTSDDVLFAVFALREKISQTDLARQRERFFAKGQPCFRASPLTKRYGWGVHSDQEGKIALYGLESEKYRELAADTSVTKKKAMRSQRVK